MSASPAIEEKVKAIIASRLGVEERAVVENAKFIEDLGADSLDIVELIMALEDAFSVDIPDEESENLRTVADVISYVKKVQDI